MTNLTVDKPWTLYWIFLGRISNTLGWEFQWRYFTLQISRLILQRKTWRPRRIWLAPLISHFNCQSKDEQAFLHAEIKTKQTSKIFKVKTNAGVIAIDRVLQKQGKYFHRITAHLVQLRRPWNGYWLPYLQNGIWKLSIGGHLLAEKIPSTITGHHHDR